MKRDEKVSQYESMKTIYRLLTGVTLPQAESLRDDDGVGVLLFVFACSTNLAYII
jgi:hypothetical protein